MKIMVALHHGPTEKTEGFATQLNNAVDNIIQDVQVVSEEANNTMIENCDDIMNAFIIQFQDKADKPPPAPVTSTQYPKVRLDSHV